VSAEPLRLVSPPKGKDEPARKRPWFKFYPADWQGDEKLRLCSMAARGMMAEFMCLMDRASPYGHLLVNGETPNDTEMTRLVGAKSIIEFRRLRDELLERGVLSRTSEGIIFSRKMVRVAQRAAVGRETGKRGGSPLLRGPNQSAPLPAASSGAAGIVDPEIDAIAAGFLERVPEIYARCRSGAVYRVSRLKQERDLAYARELASTWKNAERLEAGYEIFLRRTDIGEMNRAGTVGQFLHMAPDCDRLLRENGR
jgi:hypothetical protein